MIFRGQRELTRITAKHTLASCYMPEGVLPFFSRRLQYLTVFIQSTELSERPESRREVGQHETGPLGTLLVRKSSTLEDKVLHCGVMTN